MTSFLALRASVCVSVASNSPGNFDRSEYVHTLSGGQLIRDTLAKKGLATGFCGGKPSAGAKTYQNVRPVDQIRGR